VSKGGVEPIVYQNLLNTLRKVTSGLDQTDKQAREEMKIWALNKLEILELDYIKKYDVEIV
jgi:hypothetical protein